ncbi:hypothetical protein PGT21_001476 [Puccinia graminis f. sp. tritici]|uniref:Uncharacterized protein n=1 Tax=Puccinia graminis f. sp. tritici TaxID=56615 RepID=A0A5B0MEG1_PUCGR|nr:hypothetical protein PGT21_001476 [Puccinia graminis f. sp. tritici]
MSSGSKTDQVSIFDCRHGAPRIRPVDRAKSIPAPSLAVGATTDSDDHPSLLRFRDIILVDHCSNTCENIHKKLLIPTALSHGIA